MNLLKNKNILLAVTGSIAVYKSLELIRLYIKAGASVKVIMTNSASKFITQLTFETISQNEVLHDKNEDWSLKSHNNHIAIGKWADVFVIAPASANTINKLASGIADNIMLQTVLAYQNTKLLCPAANTNMMNNFITQQSLKTLELCNFKLINTQTKELACKDIGDGAMAEPIDIFNSTCQELLSDDYWLNRKVILNGGGSIEKIDDVRFISNFSTGKMAIAMAKALYFKGANLVFVKTSSCEDSNLLNISEYKTNTSKEMLDIISTQIQNIKQESIKKPYFFALAAISDYTPTNIQDGKLKKDNIGDIWNLELKKNIDILNEINKDGIYTIGFKAEMDKLNAFKYASNMLVNKNLSAVCLNILSEKNTFGSLTNELEVITKSSNTKLPSKDKLSLSLELLDTLKVQFDE